MTESIFQNFANEENFYLAWQKVRGNLGAPGLDRVSIEDFEKNIHDNLALLRTLVVEGTYEPLPYLTFTHKKESGKERTLRIPTVRDRVVQQALLQVVQPSFEKMFLNCSYAYRPGKSSLQAIDRVERNLKRGRVWVVDADIENFFDEIDRQLLMARVAETVSEKRVLRLIDQSVNALTDTDGKGIAQGMVLAPLLSNIYLHPMDDRMFRAQWNYIRYSDNILILCQSDDEAKSAFARAEECINDVHLKFNSEKTSVRHLRDGFSFLGFYFDEHGKRPDDPAVRRLNERVGKVLEKAAEYSESDLQDKIESIVRGWLNYFQLNENDRAKLLSQIEQKFAGDNDSMPQRILQAALAYQLGDLSRASKALRASPVMTSEDAEVNYQWGLLCDLFDMQSEALDSYLSAFRQNPDHPDAAYRLGLYYLSHYHNDQAIRYLQKAIQIAPKSAAAHFALGTALQNMALHGAARKAFQKAVLLEPKMKKLVTNTPMPAKASTAQPSANLALKANEADIGVFAQLFSGREGAFARQWLTDDGKIGYMPVYHALFEKDIKEHLAGQQTLGYYLMRSDNSVLQMIIDFDITKQVRTDVAVTYEELAEWRRLLWTDASRVREALIEVGMQSYPEDSGFKGMHLWVFFKEPVPARDVLIFSKKILAAAGPPPPGLNREVFPKQAHIDPKALGAMVKLPLGIHKLTNRRCWFLSNDGQPAKDQFAYLHSIELVPHAVFRTAFERLKSPRPVPTVAVSPVEREAVDKVFKGCNVLRHFKEKAERTKWLNHIERLTVLGSLVHLGPAGHQAIHEIISQTTNYNHRITEKFIQRAKGFPLSCPRIRERHSDITPVVGCCCQFKQIKNSYPSPVLHADPELVVKIKTREATKSGSSSGSSRASCSTVAAPATASATQPPTVTAPDPAAEIKNLFPAYLKLKKEQRSVHQQVSEIEQQLDGLCTRYQTEQFTTEFGTFKRIKIDGETKWVMEI
jgi:group II intron reverse transcriptase/maturase